MYMQYSLRLTRPAYNQCFCVAYRYLQDSLHDFSAYSESSRLVSYVDGRVGGWILGTEVGNTGLELIGWLLGVNCYQYILGVCFIYVVRVKLFPRLRKHQRDIQKYVGMEV